MERGQLGTEAQRRIIFIWEGTVARLPDHRIVRQLEWIDRHTGNWDRAVSHWALHDLALKWMWALHSRSDLRLDLAVTTRGVSFAQAVARLSERNNWPIRYVFDATAQELGRVLPTMADVERVYYGLEEQRWAYGPHGVFFEAGRGQIV